MKREDLKKLAIESGFDVAGAQGFLVAKGLEGTQDHKLRKLIELVEQATLERAANKADSVGHHWSGAPARAFFGLADEIRALKDFHE